MSILNVFFQSERVGTAEKTSDGKLCFRYEATWLTAANSFPISSSLPLDNGRFTDEQASNYFANLLPEANVRRRVCKKLGISEHNDFALLNAIGGDCAGALTLTTAEHPTNTSNDYDLIDEQQLADWSVGAPDAFSAVAGETGIRLSLAGAQDKLPVKVHDDQIFLPRGNSPSTHILKFASRDYSHLPENETFVTLIGQAIGLPVVEISLRETQRSRIAVIERYDRKTVDSGFERIHQEDFCQAMGINPNNKYQKEGGPSFVDCGNVIRKRCSLPLIEIKKLVDWSIFNLLIHNADAHGKNISLLFRDRRTELTPWYDLICTRNYDLLDRHMAMTYAGRDNPAEVLQKSLLEFGEAIGVSPAIVPETLTTMAHKMSAAIPKVVKEFRERFGDSPILERVSQLVNKRIRKALQMLGEK